MGDKDGIQPEFRADARVSEVFPFGTRPFETRWSPEDAEQKKNDLIREAVRQVAPGIGELLERYFVHVPAEDVVALAVDEVCAIVEKHRSLAEQRIIGTENVRVRPLGPRRAVVEIVTDDMPFLVDSVTQELTRRRLAIEFFFHPQVVVRRDLAGRLLHIVTDPAADTAAVAESWMHVEVNHAGDLDPADLEVGLRRILADVRAAVEDWPRMRTTALQLAAMLRAQEGSADATEVAAFLEWLAEDHFTFLGYREYRLVVVDGADALAAVAGTGLGILRADQRTPRKLTEFPPDVRARVREPRILVVTKANSRSTVHRPTYLDYIGIKTFDDAGRVIGERRFLGLFTSAAYSERVLTIPVIRQKVRQVVERSGLAATSHDGKALLEILEEYPRDDLFQISVPELYRVALGVLHLRERRRLRLFLRREEYGRFFSCLVYLPRDRYSTDVRLRIREILVDALNGTSVDDALRVTDSVLARVHFVVRVPPGSTPNIDADALERRLAAALRTWEDDFADELVRRFGEDEAARLLARYGRAFPEAYKEDFPATAAVDDVLVLEPLTAPRDIAVEVYEPNSEGSAGRDELRLKLYRVGPPISLASIVPLLASSGVEVTDERPYGIARKDAEHAWVYDFGLRLDFDIDPSERPTRRRLFEDAFAAMWRGDCEVDGFQALVLRAGLSWRQVVILRAYSKYLRQTGFRFSQDYVEAALCRNPRAAASLVAFFEKRFDPDEADRARSQDTVLHLVRRELDEVTSLDDDRILRAFLAAIQATLRTNHWQLRDDRPKPYLAFKFAGDQLDLLPRPRPKYEIFVYSPAMEGIHIRFGPVARGGIRYSDRREDFRAEILGLAKTQTVKNAVIVPVGAKGGFVVKRPLPRDPDAATVEIVSCYGTLIRGMLDLTDNLDLDTGTVLPPARTIRYDGDDAYLVVAADKGTATFSDIANRIAAEYQFWLGDAFASGGSVGYDHKAMGITARGAWESVKRHFRELGVDVESAEITCVGIGDMSGDVFGNGMLLSDRLRLVAAFDHRHIFLDPDPDPRRSYAERRRLFELPRSSWADYDPHLISAGGGVWPRTAKSIPVSPEAAAVLGIEPGERTPSDLIQAILCAPVDLLWNGGIGTYVKASNETHADVGDRVNDAVRVDATELRCRVVAEGGNLGFTQRARIEYALRGGRINTDAIDNSAGVDTSDHEVNIKILLEVARRSGRLSDAERAELLAAARDDVASLVLRDNYEQNLALSCSEARSAETLPAHAFFMESVEKSGLLDRALEYLPDAAEIERRAAAGIGLVRPELAVLLAYSKIFLTHALVDSTLPDEPFATDILASYFPTVLRERYRADMEVHPLRREIVATCLANRVVNLSGVSFVHRMLEETGATVGDVVRAHIAVRQIFGVDDLWRRVEDLDRVVPSAVQLRLFVGLRQGLERAVRWVLRSRVRGVEVGEVVNALADAGTVAVTLPTLLRGTAATARQSSVASLTADGVPTELAEAMAAFDQAVPALAIVELSGQTQRPVELVAQAYFWVADRLDLWALRDAIAALPGGNRWQTLARSAARDDLIAVHAKLTAALLEGDDPSPEAGWSAWTAQQHARIERAASTVRDAARGPADLAAITVALRELDALIG
ncbi:MAG: NAD-glutamate dehydrogenase [Acidothermus sp.]|nr:NAD-glutamate dehydrogenase [Acidothermus sp.]